MTTKTQMIPNAQASAMKLQAPILKVKGWNIHGPWPDKWHYIDPVPTDDPDLIDSIDTLLRNAGFSVTYDGPSFLVGLISRRVEIQEVEIVLDTLADQCTLTRTGPYVRVR